MYPTRAPDLADSDDDHAQRVDVVPRAPDLDDSDDDLAQGVEVVPVAPLARLRPVEILMPTKKARPLVPTAVKSAPAIPAPLVCSVKGCI